jgi:hypothetical protein
MGCAELETEGKAVVVQGNHTPLGCGYNWHSTVSLLLKSLKYSINKYLNTMSMIEYDLDDLPWTAEEVKKILELLPNNTERIHIQFHYHDVKFDAEIPFIRHSFPASTTNITASTGVTLLTTSLTQEVIDSFFHIINTKPVYSIDTIRLIYNTTVIDLNVHIKEVKILGMIEVPSACTIYTAVPNLKKYVHVFNEKDYVKTF